MTRSTEPMIVEQLRALARNFADGVAGMQPQDHLAWEAAEEFEQLLAGVHAIDERDPEKSTAWRYRREELVEMARAVGASS